VVVKLEVIRQVYETLQLTVRFRIKNMTTLSNRTKSALLIIDVQNGVVGEAHSRDAVVANINLALHNARSAGTQVIWVQHSDEEMPIGSDAWQIVSELAPLPDEARVEKTYRSSFVATNLSDILAQGQVGHLYICGAETNNCVRHTTHTALEIGYDVTLLSDAHTTTPYSWDGHTIDAQNVIDEQNDNLGHYELPGVLAQAVPTASISFE
jgi:nicotinamidase-related amidase